MTATRPTKNQSFKVSEIKRTMANSGQCPIAEETTSDGTYRLDFRALQGPALFRVSIDSKGKESTEYVFLAPIAKRLL